MTSALLDSTSYSTHGNGLPKSIAIENGRGSNRAYVRLADVPLTTRSGYWLVVRFVALPGIKFQQPLIRKQPVLD